MFNNFNNIALIFAVILLFFLIEKIFLKKKYLYNSIKKLPIFTKYFF